MHATETPQIKRLMDALVAQLENDLRVLQLRARSTRWERSGRTDGDQFASLEVTEGLWTLLIDCSLLRHDPDQDEITGPRATEWDNHLFASLVLRDPRLAPFAKNLGPQVAAAFGLEETPELSLEERPNGGRWTFDLDGLAEGTFDYFFDPLA